MVSGAVTWLPDRDLPWHVSVQGRYEIPTERHGSDVTPGQVVYLEYGVGKKVSQRVDLGVVGYGTWQVSDITGSDFTGDPTKYRFAAIGPEVQWHAVQQPNWNLAIQFRTYFDFTVLNAPQGISTILSFAFLL